MGFLGTVVVFVVEGSAGFCGSVSVHRNEVFQLSENHLPLLFLHLCWCPCYYFSLGDPQLILAAS